MTSNTRSDTAATTRASGGREAAASTPSGIRRELLGGVLWAMVATVFAQGSVFLGSIVAARILGREGFGKLALIQGAVATLGGFAAMGLGTTATKFVAELRGPAPERVGRILGLCTVVTAVTGAVFAGGLVAGAHRASDVFHVGGLELQLRLGSIYVLFFTLNAFQIGALTGFGAFAALARIGLVQGLVGVSSMALGTWLLGLTGAVVALGAAACVSWVHYQRAIREECRRHRIAISYSGLSRELAVLASFAAPAALAGIVGGSAGLVASTLLVRQAHGVREMAIFGAANTIRVVVLLVPGLVSRVSSPLLCRLKGSGDTAAFRETWWAYLSANTLMAAAAAAVLFAAGPLLLQVYGREFVDGRATLGLLLAAAVAETVGVALFQPLYTHGRFWTQLGVVCVWSTLLVGATWAWASSHGAAALAGGYLLASGASALLYAAIARKLLSREAPPTAAAEEVDPCPTCRS